MRVSSLAVVAASLILALPTAKMFAQDDALCSREAVLASYSGAVATGDMNVWAQTYASCPPHVQRAVDALVAGYQLLGSEFLPFAALNTMGDFNVLWKWYQGSSAGLVRFVDEATNTITLIADTNTNLRDDIATAPVLAYPIVSDTLITEVKLDISIVGAAHGAGLGIRASQDLTNWVMLARVGDTLEVASTIGGVTSVVETLPFDSTETSVYLKIERGLNLFTFSYSLNGEDWQVVAENVEHVIPADTEVFLTVVYPSTGAATALFSEMTVE